MIRAGPSISERCPVFEDDRVEFLRGAQSTLYGSDAMTSVIQTWSRTGTTTTPELRFGADAGNYGTENGYASLSGANGRFDYNVFGNQFNTTGSGPNDDYSNSLEGANPGAKLNDWASLRLQNAARQQRQRRAERVELQRNKCLGFQRNNLYRSPGPRPAGAPK